MSDPRVSSRAYTVEVTVECVPEALPHMERHARVGLEHFPLKRGFLGGALHVSVDGGCLVQYLQWATESDYRAAVNDPAFDPPERARST